MKTYSMGSMKLISRAIDKQRDFVSWENVWLFIKCLIAIEALYFSQGMPIQALAVAVVMVWLIWQANQL